MAAVVSIRPTGSTSTVNFDDGTSFRCTRDFVQRSNISRGQQIDPVFVDRLRESASYDLALYHAERLNRRGRYSRNELAQRLRQAGIVTSDATRALDSLVERGELDDQAVALSVARRSLRRALAREPSLSWNRFRNLHARRMALRGFGSADSSAALWQAWSEFEQSTLALDC